MTKLTESEIETFALSLLERQGYSYLYAPDIAPDADHPERTSFSDVVLEARLRAAVARINPGIAHDQREDAVRQALRCAQLTGATDLIANNQAFHRLLTEGVKVTRNESGNERGDLVWLVDFDTPENNEFLAANQFTVIEERVQKRPDIILFVNGLPLGMIELKNAGDAQATVKSAYRQIETYKAVIPSLFAYNGLCMISDGLDAKVGSISAGFTRYMRWKTADGLTEANPLVGQLETMIAGMLNKATFLDLIRHFNVFETAEKKDPKTGLVNIQTVKKLASYHQYYAVNKAVKSTLRAAGFLDVHGQPKAGRFHEDPLKYGLPTTSGKPASDRKGGVVWHTQGSGKSLSMVFYAGKIVLAMDNPTIVVLTDRNDLDDQLFDTFASSRQLLRQDPVQAESQAQLKELLSVSSGGIVFTTIQKFQPEDGNVYETLSTRENIIVLADEAHRTQYGFRARTVDEKDDAGNVIGKRTVYGFAKYMRDALPHATYLGFTGTPVESTDANTAQVFGDYVDVYDIAQAVEDGATVKIYYESRLAKIRLSEEGQELVKALDDELAQEDLTDNQKTLAKWTQLEALIGAEDRIKRVAADIVEHFTLRQEVNNGGKGMVVAMSRRIAADLFAAIVALRPDWHHDDPARGKIKIVMTAASSDGPEIAKHHTTKGQRRDLAERMRNPNDPLELVIVRDMWLTGFDAPSMHTLYIDKPMKGHNLMQAIARVNRVYGDKEGGLVVDYLGIAQDLKKALSFYTEGGGKGDPAVVQGQAVAAMLEKLEVVSQMFHGFAYEEYFTADTGRKLSLILEAEDHILGLENGKTRFVNEVAALSGAFSIAIPHEQAMDAKDEVAFFQAVKARLAKFDSSGGDRTDEELETAIRQTIDQALVSEQVIDIFDAAGIKKPDISILSDEFLADVRNYKRKNLGLELLKRLLDGEIKARTRSNLVQSRSFMEMLQYSIKRYHAKIITAAEFMEELIGHAKHIRNLDKEPQELGLSREEYAFYTAVANNDSARELMEKDKLRELAIVLFEKVRENASIDWTIKESVRAKLKVIIKRTLRQFGYPPDMQLLATETVLEQAKLIAKEISGQ
ncbi:MAG: type I restriction endonuclease subunit R [Erythrobacter sp.]|nr:MAG: type I restriction endonuclease subunit R [Erythrobacter sp.]